MSNPVANDKYWSSFLGVTSTAMTLLNQKLEELGLSTIETLKELKKQAQEGLFSRKKDGSGRVSLMGVEFLKRFLMASGVKGISGLNLSSSPTLDQLCAEAVRRTTSVSEKEVPSTKPATTTQINAEGPVFTTACGETFDPARCSVLASESYSQQKVEEFMKAYQLHKPAGANFNRMCDILKTHWIRYMTDMLSDVFMQPTVTLDGVTLRNMASERGIPIKNKSDQDVVNDLIRWLVEKVLTLDALDYGLGEASNQIVDSIMSDTLDFKKLTKKQKLAVIMMASRFNRKLMNFVIVDESTEELYQELSGFQKALSNLRSAVKSIPTPQGVKIAAGLAQSVAEAESKKKETDAKAAAEEVEVPFPTSERVSLDSVDFVANLKFPNNPATFKIISRVFELTEYLKGIALLGKKVHIFLPTDDIMKQFLEKIKKNVEQFSALPAAVSILKLLTVVESGPLLAAIKSRKGKFKAHSGDDIILTTSDHERLIQFETNEGKSRTTITASPKQHGNMIFYSSGVTTGRYTKELLGVKTTTKPSSPKASPKKTASPSKGAQGVDVKLPSMSPTKKDTEMSACEEFVTLFVKKNLTKLGEILFGIHGVLKGARGNVFELSDFKLLSKVVKASKALRSEEPGAGVLQFIYELAVSYIAQVDVNPMFDVQVDLTKPVRACRVFNDLLEARTKAVPIAKKISEEPQEYNTLNEALGAMDCLVTLQMFDMSEGTDNELLHDPELSDIFVFAPTDQVLTDYLESIGQDLDFVLSEEGGDIRDALLSSMIARKDSDDVFIMDDLTKRRAPKNKKNQAGFAEGCVLYRLEKYEMPSGIADMAGEEYDDEFIHEDDDEIEEEPTKFSLPAKGCERIYAMFQALSSVLPKTMADFVAIFDGAPDLALADARQVFVIALQERYPGFDEKIDDAVTEEMIEYIRTMMVGYNQSPAVMGKRLFDCAIFARLYTGGHSKKVADVNSKFGPTPVAQKASPPKKVATPPKSTSSTVAKKASPEKPPAKVATPPKSSPKKSVSPVHHPIIKILKSNENLSRTLYIAGLTGFDATIEAGKVRTLFAPSNDAWDKFGAQFGGIEKLLGKDGKVNKFASLLRYHSSPEAHSSDEDTLVTTLFTSGGVAKKVPLTRQRYGTGQVESFSDQKGGVIVIDTVQLDFVVDKMKTAESKVTETKSGKFGGGTSPHTQGDKFEAEVKMFLNPPAPKPASPKVTKKTHVLSEVLKSHGAQIMAHVAAQTAVKDGKTLDQLLGSAFTLFAPTDEAFSRNIGLSVQETVAYYSQTTDDFAPLIMRHIVFHATLSENDLRGYAKRNEAIIMSSEEDEDIDVGPGEGHLYLRGDYRIKHVLDHEASVIYVSDVVLTQPQDDEFVEDDE
jgi:uncharacterized surface protein with fasciclin (FAS1) repeats/cell division septation protein DedD